MAIRTKKLRVDLCDYSFSHLLTVLSFVLMPTRICYLLLSSCSFLDQWILTPLPMAIVTLLLHTNLHLDQSRASAKRSRVGRSLMIHNKLGRQDVVTSLLLHPTHTRSWRCSWSSVNVGDSYWSWSIFFDLKVATWGRQPSTGLGWTRQRQ